MSINKSKILVFVLFTALSFISLLFLLKIVKGSTLADMVLFDSPVGYSPLIYVLEAALIILGLVVLYIIPGMLWIFPFIKSNISGFKLIVYSFLTTLLLLIFATTLFKAILPYELSRINLLAIIGFLVLGGLFFFLIKGRDKVITLGINKSILLFGLIAVCVLILLAWFFQDRVLWEQDLYLAKQQGISFDDMPPDEKNVFEEFEQISSLKNHLLNFWNLAVTGRTGYVIEEPNLQYFIEVFAIILFGESFGALSLSNIIFVFLCFLVCYKIAKLGIADCGFSTHFLIFFLLPFSCIGAWALLSDSYAFTSPFPIMSLFVLIQFYFLLKKEHSFFLTFAVLAFLVKYESIILTTTGIISYSYLFNDKGRRVKTALNLFKSYFFYVFLYFIFMAGVGVLTNRLYDYLQIIIVKKIGRIGSRSVFEGLAEFAKAFLYGSCFLGLLLFFPKKDKILKFFSWAGVVFFLIILLASPKRVYHAVPLIFISAIVAGRFLALEKQKEVRNER